MMCQNVTKAISCVPTLGPTFGDRDLTICCQSNEIDISFSSLGNVYKNSGSNFPESLLAGSLKFKTTEIEVFTKVI